MQARYTLLIPLLHALLSGLRGRLQLSFSAQKQHVACAGASALTASSRCHLQSA